MLVFAIEKIFRDMFHSFSESTRGLASDRIYPEKPDEEKSLANIFHKKGCEGTQSEAFFHSFLCIVRQALPAVCDLHQPVHGIFGGIGRIHVFERRGFKKHMDAAVRGAQAFGHRRRHHG